jgi:hypothetical protein
MKRATIFLSLAALGVGLWVISREPSLISACQVNLSSTGGANAACSRMVSTTFMGVTLMVGGLMFFTVALLRMENRIRVTRSRDESTAISSLRRNEDEGLRDAA